MHSLNTSGKMIVLLLTVINICLDLYLGYLNGSASSGSSISLIFILFSISFYYGLMRGNSFVRWVVVSFSAIRIMGSIVVITGFYLVGSVLPIMPFNLIDVVFNLIISGATFICLTMVSSVREYFEDMSNTL